MQYAATALQMSSTHNNIYLNENGSKSSAVPDIIAHPICVNGITTRNYTWDEICAVIAARRLELLGRLQSQIDVYWHFRDLKLQKFATLADDIIHLKFGTDIVYNNELQRYQAKLSDLSDSNRQWPPEHRLPDHIYYKTRIHNTDTNTDTLVPIVFCPNDYGYALDTDIHHYLIWSPHVLDDSTKRMIIANELPSDQYEVVQFVNPPALQSVRNLWHCHMFVHKRTNVSQQYTNGVSNGHHSTYMSSNLVKCS